MTWPDHIGKVICGDCLVAMKDIPDGAVDLVVTDPPYGISMKGVTHHRQPGKGSRRYDFFPGDDNFEGTLLNLVLPSLKECLRVVKKTGSIYSWVSHRQLGAVVQLFENHELKTRPLIWRKLVVPPAPPYTGWSNGFELCVYAWPQGRTWNQEKAVMANVFDADSYRHGNPNKNGHPTQKPVSVISPLIRASSAPGDIVFDCFLGSGTTAVAAKQLGRKYIGIEINPDYCKIAEQRLAQEELF